MCETQREPLLSLDGWQCDELPMIDGGCVTRLGIACSPPGFRGLCLACQPAVMFTDETCYLAHHHLKLARCPHCARWLAPATLSRDHRASHAQTVNNSHRPRLVRRTA